MADRVMINDELTWGKLVKSWATGDNYMGAGTTLPPVPRTLDELKAQCQQFNVGLQLPDNIKGLAVMQYSEETLALRLPPRALVKKTEAEFAANLNSVYPIPTFYDTFYGHQLPAGHDRMDLHACRIGDYVIRNCS
jgi:hypothetical protein